MKHAIHLSISSLVALALCLSILPPAAATPPHTAAAPPAGEAARPGLFDLARDAIDSALAKLGATLRPGGPAEVPAKCTGEPIVLLDNLPRVRLAVEDPVVTGVSDGGCDITGTLHLQVTADNDVRGVPITGRVDAADRFYSSGIGYFELLIGGLVLQSAWDRHTEALSPFWDGSQLRYRAGTLTAPASWGGGSLPMTSPPVINETGLTIEGRFKIPDIVSEIIDLSLDAGLAYDSGRYKLFAYGEFGMPGLSKAMGVSKKIGAEGCGIKIGATLFYEPGTRRPVMRIRTIRPDELGPWPVAWQDKTGVGNPSTTPARVSAALAESRAGWQADAFGLPQPGLRPAGPPGLGIEHAVLGLGCDPGIPLHQEMVVFLTGVAGEISLRPDDSYLAFELTFGTSTTRVGPFTAVEVTGRGELGWKPEFRMKVSGTLKLLFLEVANASVAFSPSNGVRADLNISLAVIHFFGAMHVWGGFIWNQPPKAHVTGSGETKLGIPKGGILNVCVPVACGHRFCKWQWWIFIYMYDCGTKFCNSCVTFPETDMWLAGAGAQLGEFRNDKWGVKGFVSYLGHTQGFFLDATNRSLSFGSVDQYVLIDAAQAARARQAWQAAQQARVSSVDVDRRLAFQPDGSLIVSASTLEPEPAKNWAPSAPSDALTRTQVMTEADTLFKIASQTPLTMSLIPPAGAPEITPSNYQGPAVAPTYTVSYREVFTYTYQRPVQPGSEPRWRYVPASFAPALAAVNVQLDGRDVYTSVSLTSTAPLDYITATTGLHTIALVPVGAGAPVVTRTWDAQPGADYTIVAAGASVAAIAVFTDTNRADFPLGHGKLRLVNGVSATAPALSMAVDGGIALGPVSYQGASGYAAIPAGARNLELRDAATGAVLQSRALTVTEGDVLTLVAAEWLDGGAPQAGIADLLDESYRAMTNTQFVVDMAPRGVWHVRLQGDLTDTGWIMGVFGTPNPPVLSDATVAVTASHQALVSLRVRSEYAPALLSYYVTTGEITRAIAFTDSHGVVTTTVIPVFEGGLAGEVLISDTALLDGGQPITALLDLSSLASGQYRLWVKVEDGRSPPVMAYAAPAGGGLAPAPRAVEMAREGYDPLAAVEGAASIAIDHSAAFPAHFAEVSPTADLNYTYVFTDEYGNPAVESTRLLLTWPASQHPDADGYLVYLDTRPIPAGGVLSTTEVITVGESYGQYIDEQGRARDVGYLLDDDLLPETPYFATVGVMDHRTGLTSRSRMITFSLPLGDIGLIGPQHSIVADRSVTFTVDVTMTEDVFFDVDLYIDTEGLPQGLDVAFLDNAQRAARLRNARDARVPVGIIVDAGDDVPAGRYTLPIIAYSGGLERAIDVELEVMGIWRLPILYRP